ncbi:MAG: BatD family protein [Thiotrichaceae bacterium]
MSKKLLHIFVLFVLLTSHSWAGIKVFLNQTTVYDGDPVTLTIESDNSSTDDPDLSVLNQDFQVQGTSQSSSFSMVNGNTSYIKTWSIQLLPKGKGEIVIPAIQLGSESTSPLNLVVADLTPDVVEQNSRHVTLEATAEIGKSLPYVQQQIPYVIKLFTDETIVQGDIYAPNIENAVVEKLARDKQYSINRNGKKLNVLERHYVISPEKSGALVIPPALFKGKQVLPSENQQQRSRRGNLADSFFNDPFFSDSFFGSAFNQRGSPINSRSDSIEIDVQPIPAEYKGANWLPAEDLVITDSWGKSNPTFKVGEPVVRTLTLQTKGLTGSQIPEFTAGEPNNMRVYPDKATTETKTDGNTVFGLRQQPISYIPNASGTVLIPAVKIDWWNVVTQKQETFTLPEKEIQVLPGVGERVGKNVGGNKKQVSTPDEDAVEQSADAGQEENDLSSRSETQPSSNQWGWALLIFGGLGALTYYWLRYRKETVAVKIPADRIAPKVSSSHLFTTLQQACDSNDKASAAKLLLQIAELEWPENAPKSLGVLADRLISGSEYIRDLDKNLYADSVVGGSEAWKGNLLWKAVKDGFPRKDSTKGSVENELVASLYPDRG